jgi:predicted phage-related endonuclease
MSASTQQLEQARARMIEDRLSGIGGSDIAAVFNLGYGCARALVYEKRDNISPDHPFHGNKATERGTRLEDFAAEIYAEQTGRQIRRVAGGLTGVGKRDYEFPFMVCHSDREICNDPRGPGLLSIKVPGREMFQKIKYEGLPDSYALQLQYEMGLWGRQWGSYAILWADAWELLWFDVEYDAALSVEIEEGVKRIWAVIDSDEPLPDRLNAKDPRCGRCAFRTTCQGQALVGLMGKDDGIEVPYDPDLAELIELRNEHADIADQANALLEETNNRIKAAMGERQVLDTDGARIYYRVQKGRKTFQAEPFAKAFTQLHPDEAEEFANLATKFTNTGAPFRSLRVYPK